MVRCKHCGSLRFYFNAECKIIGNSSGRTYYTYLTYAPAHSKTKYAYCMECNRKFATIEELEKAGVFDEV